MIRQTAKQVYRNIINIPGWRTKTKYIVIESDDWGSIRMPNAQVLEKFIDKNFITANTQYNKLDTLESNQDMEMLYEVLLKHQDVQGNHPVVTANCLVANPDFIRIREAAFEKYYYETVNATFDKYSTRDKVFALWQKGLSLNIFFPQFHGREHVNVARWMKALRSGDDKVRYGFDHNTTFSGTDDYNFMESFDFDEPSELKTHRIIIEDGLRIFNELLGFNSHSFIAPCYTWDSSINDTLQNAGVKYLQGGMFQLSPKGGFNNYKRKYHYIGQKNTLGQYYLVRNCFFEPALYEKSDWIDYTLSNIQTAFRWNKPAILCTHRINFMGSLNIKNRADNLFLFDKLLTSILGKWSDVEFISSARLGDLISNNYSETYADGIH